MQALGLVRIAEEWVIQALGFFRVYKKTKDGDIVPPNTGFSLSRWYISNVDKKNETMHCNSDSTTRFLGKVSFFNNFTKSAILILHHQLPFFQSG